MTRTPRVDILVADRRIGLSFAMAGIALVMSAMFIPVSLSVGDGSVWWVGPLFYFGAMLILMAVSWAAFRDYGSDRPRPLGGVGWVMVGLCALVGANTAGDLTGDATAAVFAAGVCAAGNWIGQRTANAGLELAGRAVTELRQLGRDPDGARHLP